MKSASTKRGRTRKSPDRNKAAERVEAWGGEYLDACGQSLERARHSAQDEDWFTAYLYLYVAFNNLYCLLARFEGREPDKMGEALKILPARDIEDFYDAHYVALILGLNDGLPEQFSDGPDAGTLLPGIINMKDYFVGYEAAECVAHVDRVSSATSSTDEKRETLTAISATLLYTVRNNQFHAVKGPRREADLRTLRAAYHVLLPVAQSLYWAAHHN